MIQSDYPKWTPGVCPVQHGVRLPGPSDIYILYILDNLQIAWVRSFGYDRDWAQKHFFLNRLHSNVNPKFKSCEIPASHAGEQRRGTAGSSARGDNDPSRTGVSSIPSPSYSPTKPPSNLD